MKKFISILALLMACLLTVSLMGCDTSDTAGDTAQNEESTPEQTKPDTSEPSETNPPKKSELDLSFENEAKANFKNATNRKMSCVMDVDMTMTVEGKNIPVSQTVKTDVLTNGDNEYTDMSIRQNTNGTVAETLSKVTQIGNDFYVYSKQTAQQTAEGYLKINAQPEELQKAEQELGASESDIVFSVGHFLDVSQKQNSDGSVTYTCMGLRDTAAELYEEQFNASAGMMGVTTKFDINKQSMKYVVTVKDGNFVSVSIDMKVDMAVEIGGTTVPVFCVYDIDYTFSYGNVAPITVPTDAGFATAPVYSWAQYWQMVQNSIGN